MICSTVVYAKLTCELEFNNKRYINIGHPVCYRSGEFIYPDQNISEACILKAIRIKNEKGRTIKLIKKYDVLNFGDMLKVSY